MFVSQGSKGYNLSLQYHRTWPPPPASDASWSNGPNPSQGVDNPGEPQHHHHEFGLALGQLPVRRSARPLLSSQSGRVSKSRGTSPG